MAISRFVSCQHTPGAYSPHAQAHSLVEDGLPDQPGAKGACDSIQRGVRFDQYAFCLITLHKHKVCI